MTHLSRTLIVLTAMLGASAALAASGDQIQQRDQLKDLSCLDQAVDGAAGECLLMADQDQDRDQDRDPDQLKDGSCLDGDGIGDAVKAETRTRTGEDNGKGTVQRTRK